MSHSPVAARVAAIPESPTLAVSAKARALRAAGAPVIGFGAGEPDFPTPVHVVEAAQRAAADPVNHRYSPAAGLPALREAIVAKAMADAPGLEVDPGMVTVTNGGKHALFQLFLSLVDPGDEVIVPAPFWVSYPEMVKLAGGTVVPVATDVDSGFRATVEQLEAARTERTKALVFVSPSNPTGAVYPPEETAAIGRWAAEHGIWVVTDEIYQHLVYGGATFSSLPVVAPEAADHTIIVNGVAKTYAMTGWRVGWTIAPHELARATATLQSQSTSNVNNVAQHAALAALTGPQDAVSMMHDAFDRRRRLAVDLLRAIPGVRVAEPEGAFYVFPDLSDVLGREIGGVRVTTSLELAAVLLDQAQVALVPGEAFGAPGSVRISYALGDQDLEEGLTRIRTALA